MSAVKFEKLVRSSTGNTLALILAVVATIVIILLMFMLNFTQLLTGHTQHTTAVESASLAAADDLARVVVDNDQYGCISLSDHPPVGKATIAKDGEPLPVFGINTIIGTARLDLIIAREIGNPVMVRLANEDVQNARTAAKELTDALESSLTGGTGTNLPRDLDGNPIDIYKRAREHYEKNLVVSANGGKPVVTSFKMSLGWLENGSTTVTDVPRPDNKAQVPTSAMLNGKYKAFINIPAYGEEFYFAGVSPQAALVNPQNFRDPDGKRVCSIVKIAADHIVKLNRSDAAAQEVKVIHNVACAQPPASPDLYPPGQMSLALPAGRVPGITTIRDIISDPQLNNNPMPIYIPTGGDWPGGGTTLSGPTAADGVGGTPTVAQAFAIGFYDWLRSGKTKPRVDRVIALLDLDLFSVPGAAAGVSPTFVTYTFDGCPGDQSDPRIVALQNNTQDAQSAFWQMTTLSDIKDLVPSNSTALQGSAGTTQSTDGNKFGSKEVQDFWNYLAKSNKVAWQTRTISMQAITEAKAAGDNTWETNATLAKDNAEWTIKMSEWLAEHLKEMTLLGIKQESNFNTNGEQTEFTLGKDVQVYADGSFDTNGPKKNKLIYMKTIAVSSTADLKNPQAGGPGAMQKLAGVMSGDPQDTSWARSPGTPSNFYFFQEPIPGFGGAISGTSSAAFTGVASAGSASSGGSTGGSSSTGSTTPSSSGGKAFRFHFLNDGTILTTFALTPFANIPASHNQYYGVSYNALETGNDLKVTWTAVMRDETRTWGRALGGNHAGQPMTGSPVDYIVLPPFGGSPGASPLSWVAGVLNFGGTPLLPQPRRNYMSGGLSVDFQFRSPLILECNQPVDSTTTESGAPVTPLNPPVPPGLL